MAHTPGPWHWSDDGEGNKWGRDGLEPDVISGTVEGLVSVDDADARLIAAAPFLLETLEYIGRSTVDDTAAHLARNAIATAKGEA